MRSILRLLLLALVVAACLAAKAAVAHGQPAAAAPAPAPAPLDKAHIVGLLCMALPLIALLIKRKQPLEHWIHAPWAIGSSALLAGAINAVAQVIVAGGLNAYAIIYGVIGFLSTALAMAPSEPAAGGSTDGKLALPKIPPAAAAVAALIGFGLGTASCGPNARGDAVAFGENFANCGIGKIPQTAANVQPVVSDALQHDPAWQQALAGLGAEIGTDVVTCAVYAAVAAWQWAAKNAALATDAERGIANGRLWLSAHGVALDLHAGSIGTTFAAEATGASTAAQAAP